MRLHCAQKKNSTGDQNMRPHPENPETTDGTLQDRATALAPWVSRPVSDTRPGTMLFSPTLEQASAIAAFSAGQSFVLNGSSGTGKSTVLEAMVASETRHGLYLVSGRAAASAARRRLPRNITVVTPHSLALSHIRHRHYSDNKLFKALNGRGVANRLNLRSVKLDEHVLTKDEIGRAIRATVECYCESDSQDLLRDHVPRHPLFAVFTQRQMESYRRFIREQATVLWSLMCHESDNGIPLGHAGYFKLWTLSTPQLPYDFVLLDEAQDSTPALLHVLSNQQKRQQVFVGDRYRHIHVAGGLVNAMDQLDIPQYSLTRLFRHSQPITNLASTLLHSLGAVSALCGRDDLPGRFSADNPEAYIVRHEITLLVTLLKLESRIEQVHVLDESQGIYEILDDVRRLQQGSVGTRGELFGFKGWEAAVAFSEKVDRCPLKSIVELVESVGESKLRELVALSCKDLSEASIVLCTAQQVMDMEFNEVWLTDDFPEPLEVLKFIEKYGESSLPEAVTLSQSEKQLLLPRSEVQLLYIALTSARQRARLPDWCYTVFSDVVGDGVESSFYPDSPQPFMSSEDTLDPLVLDDCSGAQILDLGSPGVNLAEIVSPVDIALDGRQQMSIPVDIKLSLLEEESSEAQAAEQIIQALMSEEPVDEDTDSDTDELQKVLELERLFHRPLLLDNYPDWQTLDSPRPRDSATAKRDFLRYGDDGQPMEVVYLPLPEGKPQEPSQSGRPAARDFDPTFSLADKLLNRQRRVLNESEAAYAEAVMQWDVDYQRKMDTYLTSLHQWRQDVRQVQQENDKRRRYFKHDLAAWKAQNHAHGEEPGSATLKAAYLKRRPEAIKQYIERVLRQSDLPDYFPRHWSVQYLAPAKAVAVSIELVKPDALPHCPGQSIEPDEISGSDGVSATPAGNNRLFAEVVRSVCVRALYDVMESDRIKAVEHLIVTGYIRRATQAQPAVKKAALASVMTSRERFLRVQAASMHTTSCFEGLGGRGDTNSILALDPVAPFSFDDLPVVQGVTI